MYDYKKAFLLAAGFALVLPACTSELLPGAGARKTRAQWIAAAHRGDPQAQYIVGESYCCGRGIAYNTDRAIAWQCRAAVQGHRDAQFALANIYGGRQKLTTRLLQAGKGHKNLGKAYVWYTAAMVQGHEAAGAERAEIMKELDAQQLAAARRAATRWSRVQCPPIES